MDQVELKNRIRKDEDDSIRSPEVNKDRPIYLERTKVVVVNIGADHFRRKRLRTSKIARRPKYQSKCEPSDMKKTSGDIRTIISCFVEG
jgi:hypothetical protein